MNRWDFISDLQKNLIGFDTIPWQDLPRVCEKYPPENLYYVDDITVIELAVAGFSKDDIAIERSDNKLSISGKKEEANYDEDSVIYSRRNIAARSFTKTYTVSNDFKDIEATLENGMLRVTLKKDIKKVEVKQIEVK